MWKGLHNENERVDIMDYCVIIVTKLLQSDFERISQEGEKCNK